jgi:hypothetical protein
MAKDLRKASSWSNGDIQSDPEGYRAAQQAEREDLAAASKADAEAANQARFVHAFTAAGGTKTDAEAAYRRQRNERAQQAARAADEAAEAATRAATMGTV